MLTWGLGMFSPRKQQPALSVRVIQAWSIRVGFLFFFPPVEVLGDKIITALYHSPTIKKKWNPFFGLKTFLQ